MGWSIGYDSRWDRDIGYGVPAYCDHPDCHETIDRGLAYVCCAQQPYGGDDGCGLYFCEKHRTWQGKCERCDAPWDARGELPPTFDPKPEHPTWIRHLLTDASWEKWRAEHPEKCAALRTALNATPTPPSETRHEL